ncbi:hypothetical protein F2Q70_00013494 [Brassica cretica]|uniref:Uncharacterized protein n=1 Tax=Brassica cretica TaxID=69181 RepID=A0A8S9M9Y8_BRACR|nr:hypothetical protein F2Q70_00013494 [Brassica cretica]
MAAVESLPPGTPSAMRNAFGTVLSALILVLIGVLAFSIRLFSIHGNKLVGVPSSGRLVSLSEASREALKDDDWFAVKGVLCRPQ